MRIMNHMEATTATTEPAGKLVKMGSNIMVTVKKNDNVGNTFEGLIATAFPRAKNIKIDPSLQHRSTCGTVEIDGAHYDWRNNGDLITFVVAK